MTDLNSLSFEQLVPSKSKYLAKDDVGEDRIILTVRGVRMETLETDDGSEDKVILHFMEKDVKPMVLNRTNAQLLGIATGAKNAGEAKGKKIVVFNDATVSFGNKITGGLRIKKVGGPPKASETEFNDDVPF